MTRRVRSLKKSGRVNVHDAREAIAAIKSERFHSGKRKSTGRKTSGRKASGRKWARSKNSGRKSAEVTADKTASGRHLIRFRIDTGLAPRAGGGAPRIGL